MFTNLENCDIISMPNNLNIHSYRSFSRYGITIAFFAIQLSKLVLVKTLLLLDCIENLCYEKIVWRQLGLAFFGAPTSVGALFVLKGGDSMEHIGTKEAAEKFKVKLSTISAWCRDGRIPNAKQDAPSSP